MPFDEPIDPAAFRDRGALDSSVNRPFQTFDGIELHSTLSQKAAALFHSLACNHCFLNGNKRTAVMTLDIFLTANDVFLLISNDDVYDLAKATVKANQNGEPLEVTLGNLTARIEGESISFEMLTLPEIAENDLHAKLLEERDNIRSHPLNNPTPVIV